MASLHEWRQQELHTLFEPFPFASPPIHERQTVLRALDIALTHVVLAVAALNRSGSHYASLTENLWFFCAGSWSRERYDAEIAAAAKRLHGRAEERSVDADVSFAEEQVRKSSEILRREGDVRDAEDLKRAWEKVRAGMRVEKTGVRG